MYYKDMIDHALDRRNTILSKLSDNSMMIIPAADLMTKSRDTHFDFRQDSYFFYLSAINEPNLWLVLMKNNNKTESILFTHEFDPLYLIWDGERITLKDLDLLKIDKGELISEMDTKIPELIKKVEKIYFPAINIKRDKIFKWLDIAYASSRNQAYPIHFEDAYALIDTLRLTKTPQEINWMTKATDISSEGHIHTMRIAKRDMNEYELLNEIYYKYKSLGGDGEAFSGIVASGANACVLHYRDNKDILKKGDLILLDSGSSYKLYCGDITRTFPIGSSFTKEQQALYELVLHVQKSIVSIVKPGLSFETLNKETVKLISQGAIDLGILKGSLEDVIENKLYNAIFMHGIGHWLGIDVHDVGLYKDTSGNPTKFTSGMVITVEPGIYIANHHTHIDPKWHNIGIRIEDNILITKDGYHNLTQKVPKEIDDILKLRNN